MLVPDKILSAFDPEKKNMQRNAFRYLLFLPRFEMWFRTMVFMTRPMLTPMIIMTDT